MVRYRTVRVGARTKVGDIFSDFPCAANRGGEESLKGMRYFLVPVPRPKPRDPDASKNLCLLPSADYGCGLRDSAAPREIGNRCGSRKSLAPWPSKPQVVPLAISGPDPDWLTRLPNGPQVGLWSGPAESETVL